MKLTTMVRPVSQRFVRTSAVCTLHDAQVPEADEAARTHFFEIVTPAWI
jgi:hypothetical protein